MLLRGVRADARARTAVNEVCCGYREAQEARRLELQAAMDAEVCQVQAAADEDLAQTLAALKEKLTAATDVALATVRTDCAEERRQRLAALESEMADKKKAMLEQVESECSRLSKLETDKMHQLFSGPCLCCGVPVCASSRPRVRPCALRVSCRALMLQQTVSMPCAVRRASNDNVLCSRGQHPETSACARSRRNWTKRRSKRSMTSGCGRSYK